jgi:cytosine/adenosine deaminase-related metal-dependent hydrolase
MDDVYDSLRNHGTRTVNRLFNHGILGDKTLLVHCIHLNGAEMDIVKETNSMVVNNPESNMSNAVGCSPVLEMFKKGLLVGMGTDAYTFDMLESLKVALIIQRHNACMPNVGWVEATDMLFKNNPRIMKRFFNTPLGQLKKGAAADVIVMDYKPFTPFSADNIDGHMIFGMVGRQCETVMANGRLLMQDRKLIGIDEEEINAKTLEASKRLWAAL